MTEQNVATRLKVFLDYLDMTNSQFADACGIPRPSLSQLLSGRNKKISDVLVGQIHSAFPQLSVLWLLFGEGEMVCGQSGDGFSAAQNPDDEKIIPGNQEEISKYGREIGLERPSNAVEVSEIAQDRLTSRSRELERQIERMRKNPRKVVQITVYYDDNTFETFAPAN